MSGTNSVRVRVYGIVQGVGFRPFVKRIADRFGIMGSVANKGSYVEVHAQGKQAVLQIFLKALKQEAPPRSAILNIEVTPTEETPERDFSIITSERDEGDIYVSPDIATCDACKQELFDKTNRRYLHPFINCTACGPRLTILESMPYDRERTTMKEFPMCPSCEAEYTHPETRRYDAQPVCCNDCGPEVYLLGRKERGKEAITAARRAIMQGEIVAVKGIGGFHLCCDATNEEAVKRLRVLKHRPMKPFAVMLQGSAHRTPGMCGASRRTGDPGRAPEADPPSTETSGRKTLSVHRARQPDRRGDASLRAASDAPVHL
jgi:hydrogenase maturation protein HypF